MELVFKQKYVHCYLITGPTWESLLQTNHNAQYLIFYRYLPLVFGYPAEKIFTSALVCLDNTEIQEMFSQSFHSYFMNHSDLKRYVFLYPDTFSVINKKKKNRWTNTTYVLFVKYVLLLMFNYYNNKKTKKL